MSRSPTWFRRSIRVHRPVVTRGRCQSPALWRCWAPACLDSASSRAAVAAPGDRRAERATGPSCALPARFRESANGRSSPPSSSDVSRPDARAPATRCTPSRHEHRARHRQSKMLMAVRLASPCRPAVMESVCGVASRKFGSEVICNLVSREPAAQQPPWDKGAVRER